jgi:hypothetical protein
MNHNKIKKTEQVQKIISNSTLTKGQLSTLKIPLKFCDSSVIIDTSVRGYKLREPVTINLEKMLQVEQLGLVNYIISSLSVERSSLIPFVFDNKSLVELARYLLRYKTGSLQTFYHYVDTISRYARFTGMQPDDLINDVKTKKGLVQNAKLQAHVKTLENYIAKLQDDGLSPGRVHGCAKAVKSLYRVNGVRLDLPYALSRRVIYKDRAPRPEELVKLLDISNLRERVIISMLALAGFRESTLCKLEYRHVRNDLENNIVPLHIHVESDITKGKYHDYDTFLGKEAADYLRLYLEVRRKGSPDGRMPPEIITDSSPLVRDAGSKEPKPITPKRLRMVVHGLYVKAGLLKPSLGRRYDLRVHSIRKFFKSQMEALGVKTDYIEYMMGHTIDTYHDIQMKDINWLRNIYASSGISIRPKTNVSRVEMLKEVIRSFGMDPEKVLAKEAMLEPNRTKAVPGTTDDNQLVLLSQTLKDILKEELTNATR